MLGAACMASVSRSEPSTSSLRPVAPVPEVPTKVASAPNHAIGCCSCGRRAGCLLTWPDGSRRCRACVRSTTVNGGLLKMTRSWDADASVVDSPAREGFAIPLDGMAFDPATIGPFFPATVRPEFEHLGPDEVLLGTTSARLRRLQQGGSIELIGGRRMTVAGVVDGPR